MPRRSNDFLLNRQRRRTRCGFADLSLTVVKLLGRGEYVGTSPTRRSRPFRPGGAGLHPLHRSQPPLPGPHHPAPAQGGAGRTEPSPYDPKELSSLASHCTQQENDAQKVERQVRKSAAASARR